MLRRQGHRVVLYGPDAIDCEPDEHVVVTTQADRDRWGFGDGFDTAVTPFLWDRSQPYWAEPEARLVDALRDRVQPRDIVLPTTSLQLHACYPVCGTELRNPITAEWAVGYEGVAAPFCAFESYAWMHHVYGLRGWRNGRAYDQVIPNFFDPADFPRVRRPSRDYLLYVGRVVNRKGVYEASLVAERCGMPLVVAGPGGRVDAGVVHTVEGQPLAGDVDYVGPVGFQRRAELMGNAACLLAPTLYVEPFGGVAVEAMLAGTPVVASDWGSFTEIVTDMVGRRFRTLQQGADAVSGCATLDRQTIRAYASSRWSLDAVGPMFSRWFQQLDGLWGKGWGE
jgi:glycosyltransferase involved in cell wall biosynthesis